MLNLLQRKEERGKHIPRFLRIQGFHLCGQMPKSRNSVRSRSHVRSFICSRQASFSGLVGTVEIRAVSADFHGFHMPHQLKPPFRFVFLHFIKLIVPQTP